MQRVHPVISFWLQKTEWAAERFAYFSSNYEFLLHVAEDNAAYGVHQRAAVNGQTGLSSRGCFNQTKQYDVEWG